MLKKVNINLALISSSTLQQNSFLYERDLVSQNDVQNSVIHYLQTAAEGDQLSCISVERNEQTGGEYSYK